MYQPATQTIDQRTADQKNGRGLGKNETNTRGTSGCGCPY